MATLICGCGYLGLPVAKRLLAAGETVFALTRSPARAAEFETLGLKPLLGDVTQPAQLPPLPRVERVFYAVGHDRSAGLQMRTIYVDGLANILERLPDSVERLVYISSTGVYGETSGDWIDEDSPTAPRREGGHVALAAEELLLASPLADRSTILRLAGIYGPRRVPRKADLLAGQPIPASPLGYLNLIHVDDAALVAERALLAGLPQRLYLVADGHPTPRGHYYALLAKLWQAPEPTFLDSSSGDEPTRRDSSKRISNRRLLADSGLKLLYPSYVEGLQAIVAAEAASPGSIA